MSSRDKDPIKEFLRSNGADLEWLAQYCSDLRNASDRVSAIKGGLRPKVLKLIQDFGSAHEIESVCDPDAELVAVSELFEVLNRGDFWAYDILSEVADAWTDLVSKHYGSGGNG